MQKRIKILAITNVAVPYRVDFFNELSNYADVDVIYEQSTEQQTHRDASWFTNKSLNYRVISIARNDGSISYSKLFQELNKHNEYLVFMMGYSKPAARAAIIWLKSHKVPYVLTCDGGFIRKETKIKELIKRYFISGAAMYLSTAKATDEFFKHYGADELRIQRIPFTTLFKTDILTERLSVDEKNGIKNELNIHERKVIISVGQFIYRKGYDTLLEACNLIDRTYGVYIIGSEPTEEYLEMKEKYDLHNVHFVGFKNKDELKKYYMSGDLFVLPTREDVWGLVINEAMANALPIISTDKCIACVELVKNGVNGYVIQSDNPNALGEKITEVLEHEDTCELMGEESLRVIGDYTIEQMAWQHYKLFKMVISR